MSWNPQFPPNYQQQPPLTPPSPPDEVRNLRYANGTFFSWDNLPRFSFLEGVAFNNQGEIKTNLYFDEDLEVSCGPIYNNANTSAAPPAAQNYTFDVPGGGASSGGYLMIKNKRLPDHPPRFMTFDQSFWSRHSNLIIRQVDKRGREICSGLPRMISCYTHVAGANGYTTEDTPAKRRGYGNITWFSALDGHMSGSTDYEQPLAPALYMTRSLYPGWTFPDWIMPR